MTMQHYIKRPPFTFINKYYSTRICFLL